MGDLRFPASLKPIVSKGYSQTRGSNIWRVDTQGGVPRQGRDTYFEPVPISVTLVVSSLGRQAFYSFLNNIHGGADSFIMPHDTGLGIEDHQILITSTISDSTDDGKNWVLSFTATAERTAIQEDTCLTANLPDLYGCYGDFLGGFLKAYGEYMTTFPRVWEPNVIASFDFNSRVFNGISFSRASTGAYFDDGVLKAAAVNEPRYEINGLLLEPEDTNSLTYSQDMSVSTWVKTRCTISSGFLAPDGTNTASKLSQNGIIDPTAYLYQKVSWDGNWKTYTMFLKAGEITTCIFSMIIAGAYVPEGAVTFNLVTGAITGSGAARAKAIRYPGGWWRLSITAIPAVSNNGDEVRVALPSDATASVDGMYIWGAQLETGTNITSYIPTTATRATRSRDILTLTSSGAPKRVYREYTPLGSTTPVTETVPYTGVLCPPGNVRVIKVLND